MEKPLEAASFADICSQVSVLIIYLKMVLNLNGLIQKQVKIRTQYILKDLMKILNPTGTQSHTKTS